MGYSKGIVDILEAVVAYPEIRSRVRGVVSVAGAVGGSPLANGAPPWIVRIFQLAPGAECETGDLGALESLEPAERKHWLADLGLDQNDFPREVLVEAITRHVSEDLQ